MVVGRRCIARDADVPDDVTRIDVAERAEARKMRVEDVALGPMDPHLLSAEASERGRCVAIEGGEDRRSNGGLHIASHVTVHGYVGKAHHLAEVVVDDGVVGHGTDPEDPVGREPPVLGPPLGSQVVESLAHAEGDLAQPLLG
jgi:hypothetical protein